DVYQFLSRMGIAMEQKPFAVGVRIEHPQALINISQYGMDYHAKLGAADYQLTYKDEVTGRGAYTFCMCPGGHVVAASSEQEGLVTNGMSEYARDSGIANSALVVTVNKEDFDGNHPLAGMEYQRFWEKRAFKAGGENYYAPVQGVRDFLCHNTKKNMEIKSSYLPATISSDLHRVLPSYVGDVMERALKYFDSRIKGFAGEQAVLTGIETRTSSPVRILRSDSGESVNLSGLYPSGEGSGYAGGIISSAVDGMRSAEKIMQKYLPV
ncbi:MAG: hypothetical protein WCR27_06295, partial [Eubacteriales bacterium]